MTGTLEDAGGAIDAALIAREVERAHAGAPAVHAVVSYYGRADLAVPPIPDYLTDYIGRDGDWHSRETLGSPLRHVTASTVPWVSTPPRSPVKATLRNSSPVTPGMP